MTDAKQTGGYCKVWPAEDLDRAASVIARAALGAASAAVDALARDGAPGTNAEVLEELAVLASFGMELTARSAVLLDGGKESVEAGVPKEVVPLAGRYHARQAALHAHRTPAERASRAFLLETALRKVVQQLALPVASALSRPNLSAPDAFVSLVRSVALTRLTMAHPACDSERESVRLFAAFALLLKPEEILMFSSAVANNPDGFGQDKELLASLTANLLRLQAEIDRFLRPD